VQRSSSNPEQPITIEIVYALPHEQTVITVELPGGSTVGQAIVKSGLEARYPDLNLSATKLGIYGRVVSADTVLEDGDRVEIYRALLADPKQARRRRASRPR
jgi:putative ubiquitin-RnfH superfamily antitoxin RatB of RatAB toxin-antitoxin module